MSAFSPMAVQSPTLKFQGKYTRVDPYVFTCTPTLAPKQRRINRRQPKQGRGLNRNSKPPKLQSTRRSISLPEYFLAWRFAAMSRGMGWGAVGRWGGVSVSQYFGANAPKHRSCSGVQKQKDSYWLIIEPSWRPMPASSPRNSSNWSLGR